MLSDEKSKILFVDDDVQSLKLYKRKFGSMYDVRIAENGWEALDLLLAEPMDAVISDLRMPEMDGLMLLQKVREMDADILRVIITAYDDYERIMDSLNNGTVTHSFKKPLNDKYLRLVLDESLENKKIKLKNKEIMDTVKVFSKELSDKLKERTEELKEAYRLLDESDRRYKYAIKAAKQGILDWGISNDELILNDVFLENLGYERSDIILRNLEELKNYIHPDQRADFFSDLKQHMKSGNRMEKRVQLMGKSGSYIWLNFIGMVVEWDQKNRPKRFIGACIDISNQLNLEKELLRANAELKLINETKRNFIANVSHELRTPMNSILGFAGLYEESGDAEERVRYVQHIKRAAATLNRVVEDMIAFSAVGNDLMPTAMSNFKLDDFLHSIGSEIYEKAMNKDLEFSMKIDKDIPFYLLGYETLLRKTLMAVLDNAIKFTESGRVDLHVNKTTQVSKEIMLEFIVQDTGIGIQEKQRESLFIAFNQGDTSSTRQHEGLGLGLSLAMDDVKKMGGTIRIESGEKQGTRVIVEVPFKVASDVRRLEMKLLDVDRFHVIQYNRYIDQPKELSAMLGELGFKVIGVDDVNTLRKTLRERSDVCFVLSCQRALDDIRPYISVERHIVIGINNYSAEYVEGWVHGIVKKPIIASELYNVLVEALVKHHPKIAQKEMELEVPEAMVKRIEDMHVLVVEDSAMNRKMMENILHAVHVEVSFVEDGPSVLEVDHLEKYDMIFMDINLPGMDGDVVCRELRKRKSLKKLPIIGLTAEVATHSMKKYHEAGMNDVLIKPYNVEQIYRTIGKYAIAPVTSTTTSNRSKSKKPCDPMLKPLEMVGVDVNGALMRLNGSAEIYVNLLGKFMEEYADWSSERLEKEKRRPELKIIYHTLKGLAANLGANEIQRLAAILEKYAVSEEKQVGEKDIRALDQAIEGFMKAIQQVVDQYGTKEASESASKLFYTSNEIVEIVNMLIEELKQYDTAAIDRLRRLDYERFAEPIGGMFEKANKALQDFDFDTALSHVREVKEKI